jgi:F-type H+-transporting ATPase subunit alpha
VRGAVQASWAEGGPGAPPAPPGGVVRCVLALVGRPRAEVEAVLRELSDRGWRRHTAVVVAEEGTPLGWQAAAICAAVSLGGERLSTWP